MSAAPELQALLDDIRKFTYGGKPIREGDDADNRMPSVSSCAYEARHALLFPAEIRRALRWPGREFRSGGLHGAAQRSLCDRVVRRRAWGDEPQVLLMKVTDTCIFLT